MTAIILSHDFSTMSLAAVIRNLAGLIFHVIAYVRDYSYPDRCFIYFDDGIYFSNSIIRVWQFAVARSRL